MSKQDFKYNLYKIFSPYYFKVAMIIVTFMTAIPYVHARIGGYVKIVLLYGIVVVFLQVVKNGVKAFFQEKVNVVLMCFVLCYFITILINRTSNFISNLAALAYMSVFFALFFISVSFYSEKDIALEIKKLSGIIIVITFAFSIVCLAMYAFQISGSYVANGTMTYYGMYDNRLWGLYNANTNSTLCAVSIILTIAFVFDFVSSKKKALTILCIVNLFIQVSCLVLTGSRAALYVLYLVVFAWSGYYAYVHFSGKLVFNMLKSLIISVLVLAIFMTSISALKFVLSYVPGTISYISEVLNPSSDDMVDKKIERKDLTRMEEQEEREGGFFNGRVDLWKAGISALKHHFVFGIGRENIYNFAKSSLDDMQWNKHLRVGGLHNIYITILVSSGVVGFVVMLLYFILFAKEVISSIIKKTGYCNWKMAISLLLLMFYITEFVEARILYQVGILYVIFWVYSGLLFYSCKNDMYDKKEVN